VALRALLDACVLVPAALRDTLLRAGEAYLYQPVWSELILEEAKRALITALGVPAAEAADLIATMREAFPDATVSGFEDLIPLMQLDPHDRHVAAAAVAGQTHVIVTLNTKHFPPNSLAPYHVDVQSPDDFLLDLFALDPETMAQIIRQQAADLQSPPMTPHQVCNALLATAPKFVKLICPLV
jgi:predicted nucleic acid-binding protein